MSEINKDTDDSSVSRHRMDWSEDAALNIQNAPLLKTVDEQRRRLRQAWSLIDPVRRTQMMQELDGVERDQRRLTALEQLREWLMLHPALEVNDCARLHNLRESAANRSLFLLKDADTAIEESKACAEYIDAVDQTFVVKHDWASAFDGAENLDGDYNLPYQCCAFEFRISGRSCILILVDCSLGRQLGAFTQFGDVWLHIAGNNDADHPMISFMLAQVRAICIALDADVAISEVVRAPVKLNEKRAKAGKTPLPDYRVVDLARRHRVANPSTSSPGTGTKKRLHFRRGHWRHYESSKTWVKWCLVGNPDLGFIAKHYKI